MKRLETSSSLLPSSIRVVGTQRLTLQDLVILLICIMWVPTLLGGAAILLIQEELGDGQGVGGMEMYQELVYHRQE